MSDSRFPPDSDRFPPDWDRFPPDWDRFPPGWDEARVQRLIAACDSLTDDEWVAEDEAAAAAPHQATVIVPTELLPEIRRLLASHKTA